MHVGPYDEFHWTYPQLVDYTKENGLTLRAPAHEIYIGGPRRVEPERLKTIVRIAVG